MGTINQGGRSSGFVGRSDYIGEPRYARAYYDFATDGGAVGAINLRGDALPSGAVLTSSYLKVDTLVTGGAGATVSLGTEAATDVRAAATLATAPTLSATGVKQGAVTNAAPIALTADRHIVATIAVNALTAGRFSVIVEYFQPAAIV